MINKGLEGITEWDHSLGLERDGDRRKDEEVRIALHRWQKVAREWSDVYRSCTQESGSLLFEHKRRLRALEKRLNDAADAYEQARQRASQYSLPI